MTIAAIAIRDQLAVLLCTDASRIAGFELTNVAVDLYQVGSHGYRGTNGNRSVGGLEAGVAERLPLSWPAVRSSSGS